MAPVWVHTVLACGRAPPFGFRVMADSPRPVPAAASQAVMILSALTGATTPSGAPWNTMSGTDWVDIVFGDHLLGQVGDDRRLTGPGVLVLGAEPVPVAIAVGCPGSFGVGDEEVVPLGQVVHAGAGGEVSGALGAAVQHDDQRHRVAGVADRDVQVVRAGSGGAGVHRLTDRPAGVRRGLPCS